jgi:Domain of unknown function (DUF4407)
MKFKDWWLNFGCFLTGYRYDIIKVCSELSAKRVKRFTSAMLIICVIWAFVGYAFSARYLKTEWYLSLLGAITTTLIVIQIERIIILSPKGKILATSRVILGITMALIGSVIIDQILFKEDIEKEKLFTDQVKIDKLYANESVELRSQISQIDSSLNYKETERQKLNDEISRKPTQTYYTRQVTTQKNLGDTVATESTMTTATQQANPKIAILSSVDEQILKLVEQKREKETLLLNLRPTVEAKVQKNIGFLDELDVLFVLLSNSTTALIVWILWIVILLGLELLVLFGKLGEGETDYDARLKQQMELHFKRIELLEKQ